MRTNPAVPTSEITFKNNLSTGSANHEITDIEIINNIGETHTFTMTFTNNDSVTPRSWLIDIIDENNAEVATDQEIRFSGDGTPETDFNSFTVSYAPDGATPMDITFHFGEPGSFSDTTSYSGGITSTVAVDTVDGITPGVLLSSNFDSDGTLKIQYTNGEEASGGRFALAWFEDLQAMKQIGESLFLAPASADVIFSAAGEGVMGDGHQSCSQSA